MSSHLLHILINILWSVEPWSWTPVNYTSLWSDALSTKILISYTTTAVVNSLIIFSFRRELTLRTLKKRTLPFMFQRRQVVAPWKGMLTNTIFLPYPGSTKPRVGWKCTEWKIKKVQVSTCEVRYKNECHMVFGPVLGHIMIHSQFQ